VDHIAAPDLLVEFTGAVDTIIQNAIAWGAVLAFHKQWLSGTARMIADWQLLDCMADRLDNLYHRSAGLWTLGFVEANTWTNNPPIAWNRYAYQEPAIGHWNLSAPLYAFWLIMRL
jgi:hypothetical protein